MRVMSHIRHVIVSWDACFISCIYLSSLRMIKSCAFFLSFVDLVWISHVRPTQSIIHVPLQVNRFQKFILLIVQYKHLKSCSKDFILQNLILRTRLCGTEFITEPSCVLDFRPAEMNCNGGVPGLKRHFGGAGPSILYMFHRGGRLCPRKSPRKRLQKCAAEIVCFTWDMSLVFVRHDSSSTCIPFT